MIILIIIISQRVNIVCRTHHLKIRPAVTLKSIQHRKNRVLNEKKIVLRKVIDCRNNTFIIT